MASVLDRNDGETASSWLTRLNSVAESPLDAAELTQLQAFRQQASQEIAHEATNQIIAAAVARRPGETPAQHLARFQHINKGLLSIDQLLELSSRRSKLEQEVQEEKRAARERAAPEFGSSSATPPPSTPRPMTLEQVKEAYFHLASEDRQRFRIWMASGCPKSEPPTP